MGTNTTLNFLLQTTTIILRSLYVGGARNKTATRTTRKLSNPNFPLSVLHMQRTVDCGIIDTEIVSGLNKYTFQIKTIGL